MSDPAMLQAPQVPPWISTREIATGTITFLLGWLGKSLVMTGFKKAVLDSVAAELDARFKALDEHNDARFQAINERIDVLSERRQLPRRGNGHATDR